MCQKGKPKDLCDSFAVVERNRINLSIKARLHRAFAFFCINQCKKRFHPSLLSMGDANTNVRWKWAFSYLLNFEANLLVVVAAAVVVVVCIYHSYD